MGVGQTLLQGACVGFVCALGVAHAILHVNFGRKRIFLGFMLLAVLSGTYFAGSLGLLSRLFSILSETQIIRLTLFLGGLSWIVSSQFSRLFLPLARNAGWIDKGLMSLMILCGFFVAICPFMDPNALSRFGASFSVLVPLAFVVFGGVALRDGFRPARLYLIAWILFLPGLLFRMMATMNMIADSPVSLAAFLVSGCLTGVFLTLALVEAHKEKLPLPEAVEAEPVSKQPEETRDQVVEKNAQLNDFNEELAAATRYLLQRNEELDDMKKELVSKNNIAQKKLNDVTRIGDALVNLQQSIDYASRIQKGIFYDANVITRAFREAFIFLRPRDKVSGDFYWFSQTDDMIVVCAVDCTGHGVPGAFMTVMGNDMLSHIVNESKITRPDQILFMMDQKVREVFQKDLYSFQVNDGMDMAICTIYTKAAKLQYAGAKNPLIWFREGQVNLVKGSRFSIGGTHRKKEKHFELHTLDIAEGDVFYIFTDGFQDQFGGPDRRKYMTKRFRELLTWVHAMPLKDQSKALQDVLGNWMKGHEQTDDILVIGMKII